MAPKKVAAAPVETIVLGPGAREGELVFGVSIGLTQANAAMCLPWKNCQGLWARKRSLCLAGCAPPQVAHIFASFNDTVSKLRSCGTKLLLLLSFRDMLEYSFVVIIDQRWWLRCCTTRSLCTLRTCRAVKPSRA
jgi:hypothetical protein